MSKAWLQVPTFYRRDPAISNPNSGRPIQQHFLKGEILNEIRKNIYPENLVVISKFYTVIVQKCLWVCGIEEIEVKPRFWCSVTMLSSMSRHTGYTQLFSGCNATRSMLSIWNPLSPWCIDSLYISLHSFSFFGGVVCHSLLVPHLHLQC